MAQEHKDTTRGGSTVVPFYSKGNYFADDQRHSEDARFKADSFLKVFLRFVKRHTLVVNSFVDVGCGSGDIVKMIADSLRVNGFDSVSFKAYDVSPHVLNIKNEGVEYIYGDFSKSDEFVDVVTLFDVFEHVPDTIEFLKSISQRCKIIGFHIPMDYSLNFAIRNMFHSSLHNPGHIVFMDITLALNLLALSGLRVVDYEYTFGFFAPSGHSTMLSKIVFPLRYILAKISPWLLSKTFGGASLIVIAITSHGLYKIQQLND
jgi:2-polyprenyl-3-methyl-5-hydroxy-6-metoxy-1,4-benzoquinol methylase